METSSMPYCLTTNDVNTVVAFSAIVALVLTIWGAIRLRGHGVIPLVGLETVGVVVLSIVVFPQMSTEPIVAALVFVDSAALGLLTSVLLGTWPLYLARWKAFVGSAVNVLLTITIVLLATPTWVPGALSLAIILPAGVVLAYVVGSVIFLVGVSAQVVARIAELVSHMLETMTMRIRAKPERTSLPLVQNPTDTERQMILKMLSDGRISPADAAQLAKALQPAAGTGDRLPISAGVRMTIIGGLLIVLGFVLPWTHVNMMGIRGYQSGYNVGALGWVILSLGILPALLACIPALDTHVRQGMLRLIFAAAGVAFVLPLIIQGAYHVGIWIVLAGFALQLKSALDQSGLLARTNAGR